MALWRARRNGSLEVLSCLVGGLLIVLSHWWIVVSVYRQYGRPIERGAGALTGVLIKSVVVH